jgi:hypothetical protein
VLHVLRIDPQRRVEVDLRGDAAGKGAGLELGVPDSNWVMARMPLRPAFIAAK